MLNIKFNLSFILFFFLLSSSAWAASANKSLVVGAFKNDFALVQKALEDGADINTTVGSSAGNTALNIAVRENYDEIALYLIERGADVNKVNKSRKAPLHYASQNGNEQLVSVLIEQGADVYAEASHKNKPLHLALSKNHYHLVKYFKQAGVDLDSKYIQNKWRPLYYAVFKNLPESVSELIRLGVKIEHPGDKSVPLNKAIKEGFQDITRILLDGGANPKTKDYWKRDAFNTAALFEQKAIMKYLAKRYEFDEHAQKGIVEKDYYFGSPRKGMIVWFFGYETRSPDKAGKVVKLQTPLIAPSISQVIRNMDTLSYKASITKDKDNNYFLNYPENIPVNPDQPFLGGFIVDLTIYGYTNRAASSFQPIALSNKSFPAEVEAFLGDEEELQIHHPKMKAVAERFLSESKTYRDMAVKVDKFVHDHLSYDMPPKRPNTAVDVLGYTHGRCGEYNKLKSAILRSAGIPTRKITGTAAYDFGPVHLDKENTINDHVWLEAWFPGQGWLSVPSTSRFHKRLQFRDIYKRDYFIRRKGTHTYTKYHRKTSRMKRFANSHGNGVFLYLESDIFPVFSRLLKDALTYDRKVSLKIFKDLETLPLDAQVVVNWFLISRKEPAVHRTAAENFNRLIEKSEKLQKKNFVYVSSSLMKQRIADFKHSKTQKSLKPENQSGSIGAATGSIGVGSGSF
jgi:transglutaminase-like putative cysteine protease